MGSLDFGSKEKILDHQVSRFYEMINRLDNRIQETDLSSLLSIAGFHVNCLTLQIMCTVWLIFKPPICDEEMATIVVFIINNYRRCYSWFHHITIPVPSVSNWGSCPEIMQTPTTWTIKYEFYSEYISGSLIQNW